MQIIGLVVAGEERPGMRRGRFVRGELGDAGRGVV